MTTKDKQLRGSKKQASRTAKQDHTATAEKAEIPESKMLKGNAGSAKSKEVVKQKGA